MTARKSTPGSARDKPTRWTRFRVGMLAIVLIAIATYFGFAKHIPFTHSYRLHAVFQSSNNLRPGSPVRIAGVNVGKVMDVTRYKSTNLTDVTMEIDDAGLPIHRDATLKIRPRIFLEGNFFVDLKPGSPSAPEVPENGTIGAAQTATPVQLDELFTALQSNSRADLQVVLDQLGKALNAPPTAAQNATQEPEVQGLTGGQAFNKAYTYSPQALKGAAIVNSGLLGTEPHDLSRLIGSVAKLTTNLRGHEAQLQSLIVNLNTTAGAFAAQSSSLAAAVGLLGPTLTTADAAFKSVDASLPATRAFARAILPGIQQTPATVQAGFPWLAQTKALLSKNELQGLLAQLQPATADLARLEGATLQFLPQLDQADRCFSQVIIPAGNIGIKDGALTTRRTDGSIVENYKEFWYGMVGLTGEGQNFDGNGNYLRFAVGGGSHTVDVGTSKNIGGKVIGNANFAPLGISPLYPTRQPQYNLTAPCYRNAPPNINGPLAGPGKAPTSVVAPTPPPLPASGTTTPASASSTSSGASLVDAPANASVGSQLLSHLNPLHGAGR
jgi:phospholipid/cholesterol/gamma-HCH transport system substrate-binding protein